VLDLRHAMYSQLVAVLCQLREYTPSERSHEFVEQMHDFGPLRLQPLMISMRADQTLLRVFEILNIGNLRIELDDSSEEIVFSSGRVQLA